MQHSYYSAPCTIFMSDYQSSILGKLTKHHSFALEDLQRNAWIAQIKILKRECASLSNAHIAFEYVIPRMGKRVDVILLHAGIVFVLEFKIGSSEYSKSTYNQVLDYAIDLKNFHKQSHNKTIVPIIISTNAPPVEIVLNRFDDNVYQPISCNEHNIASTIKVISETVKNTNLSTPLEWLNSTYSPTPTIIEAAQALYQGHDVTEITRSDSGTINLAKTSDSIITIINHSQKNYRKSICFLTGVPGAGKTLAGLNIANLQHNIDRGEHAVFLSGNGPLVEVLQEALAQNDVIKNKKMGIKISVDNARRKTKAFIQNIHHFRDTEIKSDNPPAEHVVIFDEAQRAWTKNKATEFMKQKKGILNFNMSEPEFLISVLDKHQDWATIICLIGGGQEINKGEAGLPEWFSAIEKSYPHWDVYASDQLTDLEYTNGREIYSSLTSQQLTILPELHLAVSIRSFRSEKLASFIKKLLDSDSSEAKKIFQELKSSYPIIITRNLNSAKQWLNKKSRGTEGKGIVASSGAIRLKPNGLHVKSNIDPKTWFLSKSSDIRSSNFLEDVATEFDIQGLELDWICVAWDANLRRNDNQWEYKNFRGTTWNSINLSINQQYLLNAYRVLLTRARQGMIIFIPKGDATDKTRLPEFYNGIHEYLTECGIPTIE